MQRLSLSNRVALLSVAVVLITGLLVQWLTFSQMTAGVVKEQQQLLQAKSLNLAQSMDSYRDDVALLAGLGEIKSWLASTPLPPTPPISISKTFSRLMEFTPDYFQARVLDAQGHELLKLERQENGQLQQLPQSQLQDKSGRDYVINSQGLSQGQVYVSPLNLNQEFGRIQIPHLPTVRLVSPVVADNGKRLGFVILNVDFRYDLNNYLLDAESESYTYLVNEKGQILFSPKPDESFAFELGRDLRIQDKFPSLVNDIVKLDANNNLELLRQTDSVDGNYYFAEPIAYTQDASTNRYWLVIRALPQHFLLADALQFRNIFLLQLVVVVVAMFLLLTFGIRRLLYPLRLLGKATYQVARGQYGVTLPTAKSKELSRLTDDFSHMLKRLKDREAELSQSKDRFALFLSKVPCQVAIFDQGMRYVAASDTWLERHGLDSLHYIGHSHYDIYQLDSDEWRSVYARCLRGESLRCEEDSFLVAGQVQWLHWEVIPWYESADKQGGIIVFKDDITERKRLEAENLERQMLLRTTFDNAAEGIAMVDPDLSWRSVNKVLARSLGYQLQDLEGQSVNAILSPESRNLLRHALVALKEEPYTHQCLDMAFHAKDGRDVLLETHIAVVLGRGEQLRHYVFQTRDVTMVRRLEQQQALVAQRLEMATRAGQIGIWEYLPATDTLLWDEQMYVLFDLAEPHEKMLMDRWQEQVHPEDLAAVMRGFEQTVKLGVPLDLQFRILLERGLRYIRVMAQSVKDDAGKVIRVVGCNWDITDFKLAEQSLAEEKERLHVTLGAIGDAVLCTDGQGNVTFLNHVAEDLLAWPLEQARQQSVESLFAFYSEQSNSPLDNPVLSCLQEKNVQLPVQDLVMVNRHGKRFDVITSVAPVRDARGVVSGTVMVFQDLTRTKALQRELSHASAHDALTDLVNRAQFEQCVERCIDRVKRTGKTAQLCFFDLDSFKVLNDTAGHSAGDALLVELGQLWRKLIRHDEDVLARLGGDEFGLLLEQCSADNARQFAQQMLDTAQKLNFHWEDQDYDVTACVGIASITPATQSLAEVMSHADVACYAAKAAGRAKVCIYSGDDTAAQLSHQELMMASRLKAAISQQRFMLYSQTIEAFDGEERMAELLLRLRSDDGGIIGPAAFIPAAERYDLMEQLDLWVVDQVLSQQAMALARSPIDCFFINLSANSLSSEAFAQQLLDKISNSALPASRVCFEITETALINQMSNAVRLVQQLRSIGARVAIDDFGSGLSSFAYLRHFQVDFIKIDGCFVQNAAQNPLDRTIISSVSNIAHRMQARSIAEWVENDVTAHLMHKLGLDFAQGYFFSRPRPLTELLEDAEGAEQPSATLGKTGGVN
ncbi:EAL domain-containing protein [Gallaecimonas mangrovi]|uniref:EAL domain-containing protein n=1 Tax=Gallaecimonas mangrovi TaxID=2291597 RepID=UPI001868A191|nr:EAL domain-containing protein [Gallaecimonas mangrovi]